VFAAVTQNSLAGISALSTHSARNSTWPDPL